MDMEAEKRSVCGNVECSINFHREGKSRTYRRDDGGMVFRVFTTAQKLDGPNKAGKNAEVHLKSKEFTETSRLERRLENRFHECLDRKEGGLKVGLRHHGKTVQNSTIQPNGAEPEALFHDRGISRKIGRSKGTVCLLRCPAADGVTGLTYASREWPCWAGVGAA
jgi:hypothetical protein